MSLSSLSISLLSDSGFFSLPDEAWIENKESESDEATLESSIESLTDVPALTTNDVYV